MKTNALVAGVLALAWTMVCHSDSALAAARYVNADSERAWVGTTKWIRATDLLRWLTANQKLGTLTLEPDPINPGGPIYPSHQATYNEVLTAAQNAGFVTEAQLLATLAIAVSESSLWTADRNFHKEYGLRPASDVIGVKGSSDMWVGDRQYNSDRGLWQISSYWWPQFTDLQCDTPAKAALAMWAISQHGTNFNPWDPYKAGTAQKHYDTAFDGWPALRPIVRQFLLGT